MKYKKILMVVPMVMMLSTPAIISPITAFAAENTNSAKLYRNGSFIQLPSQSNTSSDYPQADKNPYKEPDMYITTNTKTKSAGRSDFIKIAEYEDKSTNTSGAYGIKNGQFVCNVTVNGKSETLPVNNEELNKIAQRSDLLTGTQFKQEIRWKRIYNRLQPKSTQNQWSVANTFGITEANTKEFAWSVGGEIAGELGKSDIGKIGAKISASISEKFSTTTTVTKSTTTTVTDTFPVKPENYPYNDYRVAVYQKEEIYTVIPGGNLQKAIKDLEKVMNTISGVHANFSNTSNLTQFIYTTDELRPIVTPN
ncbi:hypothetical protein [Bacillus toyonensis]|uniref:Uncharacterized protein n=1 Tax=Bacillus toyonensis TaxID=155322 RepID=A0A2B5XHH0_9BACI|nr:hypothetical protein [Bacillus toyonensis]PGA95749.1 hypothetical protein COL93_24565 [Bacillus toyonensis]PHD72666.1 hypothetical protein COF40_05225 [Bacillus toyonensis]